MNLIYQQGSYRSEQNYQPTALITFIQLSKQQQQSSHSFKAHGHSLNYTITTSQNSGLNSFKSDEIIQTIFMYFTTKELK